ncbi:MAG: hypothetical protein NTY38_08990 [Acidobacteria bacterium]|nr:hypothetical protein [Acidobacteriota bacterium]
MALYERVRFNVGGFKQGQRSLSGDRAFVGIGFLDHDPEQPLPEAMVDNLRRSESIRLDGSDRGGVFPKECGLLIQMQACKAGALTN